MGHRANICAGPSTSSEMDTTEQASLSPLSLPHPTYLLHPLHLLFPFSLFHPFPFLPFLGVYFRGVGQRGGLQQEIMNLSAHFGLWLCVPSGK